MSIIETRLPDTFRPARAAIPHSYMRSMMAYVTAAVDSLLDALERNRQRRQLLGLSDQSLADFAASRADAVAEGAKSLWHA